MHSRTNQSADQAAACGAQACTGKCNHNRGRDEWSNTSDHECPDRQHPTHSSTYENADACSGSCSFEGPGALQVSEVPDSHLVATQNRNIIVREAGALELIGDAERLVFAPGETE
jgi:hypothetical protein